MEGCLCVKMGNVANRHILYQQFAEGGSEEVSIPAPWTENDQTELDALRNAPIKMANTSYGHFLAQQKRDVEQAYQKMSDEEKVDFKRKMAEFDVAGANDMQSVSSSLTPVWLMSSNCLELLLLSFLFVSIDLCGRQSHRPRVSTNVSIFWHLEI